MQEAQAILPGATLGVLGSGQLGRMFAQAATRLGYNVHVFSDCEICPAGQVAAYKTVADYGDTAAVEKYAQSVDVVTYEFENVCTKAVEIIEQMVPVRPSRNVLHIVQNRWREKSFLEQAGVACTPFAEVTSSEQLQTAVEQVGTPSVLKTAESGYDGKGQIKISSPAEAEAAWDSIERAPAILEGWVEYERELSVIVTRNLAGDITIHGPIANDHANHILDVSMFPLPELEPVTEEAHRLGRQVAEALDLVGVCCIEFFLTQDGQLLANEIAPRPHNSGHLTIEACSSSQFDQQVRSICNLPLGNDGIVSPAAMVNLLGDLWENGEPNWEAALKNPNVHLHLYGKTEARPGRKMGHLTVLGPSAKEAAAEALAARELLKR